MLEKILSILVFLTFSINIFLAGLERGFNFHYQKYGLSGIGFAGSSYLWISFLLLVFLLGKKTKKKFLSNILCLTSLSFILFQYKNIYLYKKLLSDAGDPISILLRESIPLDVISFSAILILLFTQIIMIFQNYFEWKRTKSKIE